MSKALDKCNCGHIREVHYEVCQPPIRSDLYNEECFCPHFEAYTNLGYLEYRYEHSRERLMEKVGVLSEESKS